MSKEDIKKAKAENAERIANIAYSGGGHIGQDDLETAFENGAEWRINSVWHDANKIPDKAELTLVEFPDGRIDIVYFHTIKSWRSMVKRNGTIRWAYIKDLIPNTED